MHACMYVCTYVPIIKKYTCAYICGCMKSAQCSNLVLVIKDQGYALTIDYIKKKQKLTLVSPDTANSILFYNIKSVSAGRLTFFLNRSKFGFWRKS